MENHTGNPLVFLDDYLKERIEEALYSIAGFPNVIGAIDCTHVRIQATSGPAEADYVNRKSFHSLNVQVICNESCLVSNTEAKMARLCPSFKDLPGIITVTEDVVTTQGFLLQK